MNLVFDSVLGAGQGSGAWEGAGAMLLKSWLQGGISLSSFFGKTSSHSDGHRVEWTPPQLGAPESLGGGRLSG